jgi:membrane peptidoglycan carboxypeptidase
MLHQNLRSTPGANHTASSEFDFPLARSGNASCRKRLSFTQRCSSLSDRMFGSFATDAARKYSHIIGVPADFVEFLLLIEDKRFAIHFGIDPIAIGRALIFDVRGCPVQGASTIVQQIFTIRWTLSSGSPERTLLYKLRQAGHALVYSASAPKTSILAEYINTVYWGRSYYGIDDAAKGYFNACRRSLSCAQSFFLAERIALPNQLSLPRIRNLLRRPAVAAAVARYGIKPADLVEVYGCMFDGGNLW